MVLQAGTASVCCSARGAKVREGGQLELKPRH